ncbi:MAG: hypothetical protein Q7S67_03255, partial [Telluria sp.]|nr:hypothetical protein [Telluria sp.]
RSTTLPFIANCLNSPIIVMLAPWNVKKRHRNHTLNQLETKPPAAVPTPGGFFGRRQKPGIGGPKGV